MTIKRGGIAEPISGNIYIKEIPAYCPKCHVGKLQPRVYREEELIAGSQLPYDHNQWRQCYRCGTLVPIHDIPKEGQLTTDVERISTKFQTQREEGDEHYKPPAHRRGFNERLDQKQDDGVKDPELKRELKKGAKLLSYSES